MFAVIDKRTNKKVSKFNTYEQADAAIVKYEVDDLWEGCYADDSYDVVEDKEKAPSKKRKGSKKKK